VSADMEPVDGLSIVVTLAPEQVEAIAERAAALLAARAPQGSPWLSTAGAAEYMDCSPARIHDLVQARMLTPRRDGRRLLFRREELDAYLEGSR
jgi:excisionase family DNA binding protein